MGKDRTIDHDASETEFFIVSSCFQDRKTTQELQFCITKLHHFIRMYGGAEEERPEKKHKKEKVGKYNFTSISKMKESSI